MRNYEILKEKDKKKRKEKKTKRITSFPFTGN